MTTQEQIQKNIASQPEPKRADMEKLHKFILKILPKTKLWFETGINSEGKKVSNPTIGYGLFTIKYADGKTREFFQIGMSANTAGVTIYVMGLKDRAYLTKTFGKTLGKASVTSYCIKFKSLKDIDLSVLEEAIRYGVAETGA